MAPPAQASPSDSSREAPGNPRTINKGTEQEEGALAPYLLILGHKASATKEEEQIVSPTPAIGRLSSAREPARHGWTPCRSEGESANEEYLPKNADTSGGGSVPDYTNKRTEDSPPTNLKTHVLLGLEAHELGRVATRR
ncbi:hypothetical protein NDU88_003285 [Pleurodeles waltl]|uniref:Uncharacterized protein n=1 Tax=Pleurodeles waltl TaxID=8319 RepID=A0AAV7QBP9_PLEWA|nr:hypothetical protein NDU88_003285 [Pleurodeles waltl]